MFLIIKLVYQNLKRLNDLCKQDTRAAEIPGVGSPLPIAAIIVVYLVFVKNLGPKMMENRKPFQLNRVMQVYNVLQVLINLFVFIYSLKGSYWQSDFSMSCQGYDPNFIPIGMDSLLAASKVCFASKVMDLLDTVFFVLRKKQNQVSFLNVYHHAMMVIGTWMYLTFFYANHFTMTGVVNSFVHVVMYSYYFIAALKLDIDLTHWKKMITRMQLLQFLFFVYHFSLPLLNNTCNLNLFWVGLTFAQNLFMLILFSDFYYKAYVAKRPAKQLKQQQQQSQEALTGDTGNGIRENNLHTHISKATKVQ